MQPINARGSVAMATRNYAMKTYLTLTKRLHIYIRIFCLPTERIVLAVTPSVVFGRCSVRNPVRYANYVFLVVFLRP